MEFLLDAQFWVLNRSPSLLPIFAVFLAFFQSWHCAAMCGPLIWSKNKDQQNLYLQGRLVSYTLASGLAGGIGKSLLDNADFKILSLLSFLMFATLSLVLILFWFFKIPLHRFLQLKSHHLVGRLNISAFSQGLLSISIPCPIIFQMLSLALASQTLFGGLIIGLGHAVASTPALWKSSQWFQKLQGKSKLLQSLVKVVVVLVLALQLFFYFGKWTSTGNEHLQKVLFCF